MAQSKKNTPGQTFTALLPWDRWLSPKRTPRDRHLLLYYPGTDGSVQKEDPGTDIYCFTTLGQMPQSNRSRPWDRHLLLYYPGTDGSVQKEHPGTDIYCFTTLGQMAQSKKNTPGQTFTALLPWDRWLSPKRRPWDRHLLLYYPGTDASIQPK